MLLDPNNPQDRYTFLDRARRHIPLNDPMLSIGHNAEPDPRLRQATLIAREALATRSDLDNAHNTARLYRSGAWDGNGEMRTAILVAYLALSAAA